MAIIGLPSPLLGSLSSPIPQLRKAHNNSHTYKLTKRESNK
jgi:hypothetical protein